MSSASSKSPKIIAIIPARGGSKEIPRKNVLPICGKPLIGWTIDAAKAAKHVDRVVVSTDDSEIASVSKRFGAEVVWRPEKISGDLASSEDALLHTLEYLEQSEGYRPEIVVFLQCTSPLRKRTDIDKAIKTLMKNEYDSVFSVFEKHYMIWRPTSGDLVSFNFDHKNRAMRQDSEKEYVENGSIFVFKRNMFLTSKNRMCGRKGVYVMPYEYSFEIDSPFDFWLCERLIKKNGRDKV